MKRRTVITAVAFVVAGLGVGVGVNMYSSSALRGQVANMQLPGGGTEPATLIEEGADDLLSLLPCETLDDVEPEPAMSMVPLVSAQNPFLPPCIRPTIFPSNVDCKLYDLPDVNNPPNTVKVCGGACPKGKACGMKRGTTTCECTETLEYDQDCGAGALACGGGCKTEYCEETNPGPDKPSYYPCPDTGVCKNGKVCKWSCVFSGNVAGVPVCGCMNTGCLDCGATVNGTCPANAKCPAGKTCGFGVKCKDGSECSAAGLCKDGKTPCKPCACK